MAPIVAATPPPTLDLPTPVQSAVAASPGWDTYVVKNGDSLHTIAHRHHTTVAALVSRNNLPNGGRLIHPGQRLQVPGRSASPAQAPGSPTTTTTYTIRSGDTLIGIAQRHKTSARALAALNKISVSGTIHPGQKLRVPSDGKTAAKAANTSTVATKPAAPNPQPAATGSYTVRAGDTLIGIAQRHKTTARAIAGLNKISVNGIIRVGQKLTVPTDGTQAAKAASSSKPAAKKSTAPQPEMSTPFNSGGYSARHFPSTTVSAAKKNHALLSTLPVPTRDQAKAMIIETAKRHGVDPALALAISYQESGWNHRQVSVANAIGLMQVIPASGDWASQLIGRELNLLDPQDNITAGVVIIRAHLRSTTDESIAIAAYYQGMASVRSKGMYSDTRAYVRNIHALRAKFG